MFERLKKVFGRSDKTIDSPVTADAVSRWAGSQGFSYTGYGDNPAFAVTGKIGDKPWKLERGPSTRDYIRGEELRARAELKVNDDAAVLVMNRPLKEALEKRAYEMYTDTLQTIADPSLPEEMRWLAMYPEVGWDGLPPAFWKRYSVLADRREHALGWLDSNLAELLMSWPEPAPDEKIPFMLMLLRGKAYLRMQYTPANMPALKHATQIFTSACESAVTGLETDVVL